ncbi:MAG: helix-turn-helix domain-containing protein [bacterium]|nr:helix-turn-helix domain-containing protein [bacterium]
MYDIKKLLGAKISQIRKERGFSQIQFAEMIGLSTNALSIIETGNGFLTAETLEKILENLCIEPEELFYFGGMKSDGDLYKNIIKNLDIIKNDRSKLVIVDNLLKTII